MVQACSPAFLQLGTGKVTGEPCAGTAADAVRINPLPPAKPAEINPQAHVVYVDPPAADPKTDKNNKNKKNKSDDSGAGNRARGAQDGKNNQ
jgi:hypothetical protein